MIREAKKMAARIAQPSDLWELEHYLTERRKEIDRKYDYRYSVLPLVFGCLIREGRLREEELRGLGEDKLGRIRGRDESSPARSERRRRRKCWVSGHDHSSPFLGAALALGEVGVPRLALRSQVASRFARDDKVRN